MTIFSVQILHFIHHEEWGRFLWHWLTQIPGSFHYICYVDMSALADKVGVHSVCKTVAVIVDKGGKYKADVQSGGIANVHCSGKADVYSLGKADVN